MAKSDGLEDGRVRGLMVSFVQEYDTYRDTTTGGGDNDGYTLEVRGSTVTYVPGGSDMKSEWSSPNGLGSFFAVGQTTRRENGSPIHCTVEYRDLIRVSRFEARQMVKVFDKVDRAMLKADERDGYHKTIGQYLARVARAVGATEIAMERSDNNGRGVLSDHTVVMSLGAGVDAIDSRINAWVEKRLTVQDKRR